MRSTIAVSSILLLSTSGLACDIDTQTNLKLEPKDQAALVSLGKAINSQELLEGTSVSVLFSEPRGVLTLNASDTTTLSKALVGLPKATACHSDGVVMERIFEDNTPGIRFLRQIEGCLADACVDNH